MHDFPNGFWAMAVIGLIIAGAVIVDWTIELYHEEGE